jgi:hypothetical protein
VRLEARIDNGAFSAMESLWVQLMYSYQQNQA